MPYILRFIQTYLPKDEKAFLEWEARFVQMEDLPGFTKGRRSRPLVGARPTNTLLWEAEFPTLPEVYATLAKLASDPRHAELFEKQVPYMQDARVEIDEVLEFSTPEVRS